MKTTPDHSALLSELFDVEPDLRAPSLDAGLRTLRARRRARTRNRRIAAGACVVLPLLILPLFLLHRPAPDLVSTPAPQPEEPRFEIVSTRKISEEYIVRRTAGSAPDIEMVSTRTGALSRLSELSDAQLLESFGTLPRMLVRYNNGARLILLESEPPNDGNGAGGGSRES